MYRAATSTKRHLHNNHSNFDLNHDIKKIKSAFADAAYDVKGKTGEIFTQSVDGLREKSVKLKDNVAEYTAEKPFKSLGVALLLGVALGYFLKKR